MDLFENKSKQDIQVELPPPPTSKTREPEGNVFVNGKQFSEQAYNTIYFKKPLWIRNLLKDFQNLSISL